MTLSSSLSICPHSRAENGSILPDISLEIHNLLMLQKRSNLGSESVGEIALVIIEQVLGRHKGAPSIALICHLKEKFHEQGIQVAA